MSRIYEAGVTKTTSAAAGPIAQMCEASGGRRASLLELGIFATTAVAGEIGLGLPANTPTVPVGTTVLAADGQDETGFGLLANAWTTAPTAPANFRRRIQLPAVIGAGVIWQWNPGECIIPVNAFNLSPVLWQISTAAVTYDVYMKVME